MSSALRVSDRTHRTLKTLAEAEGATLQEIADKAIEAYRREAFLRRLNAEFAALRNDPARWQEEEEERAVWDKALMDDLQDDSTE